MKDSTNDIHPEVHLLSQRLVSTWLKYIQTQDNSLLELTKQIQQRLYTMQVYLLEGNEKQALTLSYNTPWPRV